MSWLSLTILAQFLNSVVAVMDKYLVTSKKITTPILYVFYTGILTSLGILIYIPSLFVGNIGLPTLTNVQGLSFGTFALLIATCTFQLVGLWALFSSLKKNDASDVVPVVGSMSAIFSLLVSYFFADLVLPTTFAIGFALLVSGTLLISHLKFSMKTFLITVLGGFSFALYNILLKIVIQMSSFDSAFFWFSILTTGLTVFLLFSSSVRKAFHGNRKENHVKSTGTILLVNKVIAGVAGILLIKAIEVGEVSIVQALGGLQFVFLFVIALLLGPFTPYDFGENINRKDMYHKLVSISIIFIGFVLLFI